MTVRARLLAALKAATQELVSYRESDFDCLTDSEGEFPYEDEKQAIAELDDLIDQCNQAIAEAEKTTTNED